jgi:hypothetical protein
VEYHHLHYQTDIISTTRPQIHAQTRKSGGSGDGGDTFRLTGGIQRFNQARSHWYQKIQRNAHECCQGRARDYGLWQG